MLGFSQPNGLKNSGIQGDYLLFLLNIAHWKPILIRIKIYTKSNDVLKQMVDEFMAPIIAKNTGEVEFHQAVREVAESLLPYIEENPKYKHAKIL